MTTSQEAPGPTLGRPGGLPGTRGQVDSHSDDDLQAHSTDLVSRAGHGGHGLMMLVCCVPMILVAVLLVSTGAVGSGALLWALGCVAMMAMMMFAMPGGHHHK